MSRHTRLQRTLRSPYRRRTLARRTRRKAALAGYYAEFADLPEAVRPRIVAVRKTASLVPASRLRALFPSGKR